MKSCAVQKNDGGGSESPMAGMIVQNLRDDDILLGRGNGPNEHPGNRRYRTIIYAFQPEYLSTKERKEKEKIARKAIQHVEANGSLFLKQIPIEEETPSDDGLTVAISSSARRSNPAARNSNRATRKSVTRRWEEVARDAVLEKTKQALRFVCQTQKERAAGLSKRNDETSNVDEVLVDERLACGAQQHFEHRGSTEQTAVVFGQVEPIPADSYASLPSGHARPRRWDDRNRSSSSLRPSRGHDAFAAVNGKGGNASVPISDSAASSSTPTNRSSGAAAVAWPRRYEKRNSRRQRSEMVSADHDLAMYPGNRRHQPVVAAALPSDGDFVASLPSSIAMGGAATDALFSTATATPPLQPPSISDPSIGLLALLIGGQTSVANSSSFLPSSGDAPYSLPSAGAALYGQEVLPSNNIISLLSQQQQLLLAYNKKSDPATAIDLSLSLVSGLYSWWCFFACENDPTPPTFASLSPVDRYLLGLPSSLQYFSGAPAGGHADDSAIPDLPSMGIRYTVQQDGSHSAGGDSIFRRYGGGNGGGAGHHVIQLYSHGGRVSSTMPPLLPR